MTASPVMPSFHFKCSTAVESQQTVLTLAVPAWHLSLYGHITGTDDNADAKKILIVSSPEDWRRPPGCPCIYWMNAVFSPTNSHWLKQSTWLRTGHSGCCWLRVVLHNPFSERQKCWWWLSRSWMAVVVFCCSSASASCWSLPYVFYCRVLSAPLSV